MTELLTKGELAITLDARFRRSRSPALNVFLLEVLALPAATARWSLILFFRFLGRDLSFSGEFYGTFGIFGVVGYCVLEG